MAAQKFGVSGFTTLLPQHTRSHASLDSETVRALAGRPAWLYEQATGAVAGGTDQEPVSPLNPSGRLGHDHSGPPYGSALQHPLWTFGGHQTVSQLTRDDGTSNYIGGCTLIVTATVNPIIVCRFYCRPFPRYEGSPYSRAYLGLTALHGSSSGTLTVDLWSSDAPENVRTDSITVNDTSWPPQMCEFSTAYWDVKPGWNKHYLKLSSSNSFIGVSAVSASQIVKRSH